MKGLWLTLAWLGCVVGMGWLALAMEAHWHQVRGGESPTRRVATLLRLLGVAALGASLLACLRADHGSMAALVWPMLLALAAVSIALVLAWRPRLLWPLVGWLPDLRGARSDRRHGG